MQVKNKEKEKKKEKCGHCASYDMWCGICLNPKSKLWEMEAEYIYEYPCCDLFVMEESYKEAQEKNSM